MKQDQTKIERARAPFRYTLGEDLANSISHGVGAGIALVLFVLLIQKATATHNTMTIISCIIYGLAVLLMLISSTIYHAIRISSARTVLKRIDHAFIFILILATYMPIIFIGIQTTRAYILFGILTFLTVVGVTFKSIFSDRYKRLLTVIFILMGWSVVFMIPDMASLNPQMIQWLIIGGVAYTVGAILFIFGKFPYYHFIWHIFVLLGVFAHYIAILFFLF